MMTQYLFAFKHYKNGEYVDLKTVKAETKEKALEILSKNHKGVFVAFGKVRIDGDSQP